MFRGAPLSWQARRAIKLTGTAFSWTIGLCLVVVAIAVVTRSPGRPVHVAAAASASHAPRAGSHRKAAGSTSKTGVSGTLPAHPVRPVRPVRRRTRHRIVIAAFSGAGSQTTGQFTVAPARVWALRWSYICSASQQAGTFTVTEAGTAAADIVAHGPSGSGETWIHPDGSTHALSVVSTCSWTVKVVAFP